MPNDDEERTAEDVTPEELRDLLREIHADEDGGE